MSIEPELDIEEGPGGDRITLTVPRAVVEQGNALAIVNRLEPLLGDAILGPKALGRLQIVIAGYENDPRELWEITPVRRMLSALNSMVPVWFYLADLRTPTLMMVMSCLCRVKRKGNGQWKFEPSEVEGFMDEQFRGMNALIDEWHLPEAVRYDRSVAVTAYMMKHATPPKPAARKRPKKR